MQLVLCILLVYTIRLIDILGHPAAFKAILNDNFKFGV